MDERAVHFLQRGATEDRDASDLESKQPHQRLPSWTRLSAGLVLRSLNYTSCARPRGFMPRFIIDLCY